MGPLAAMIFSRKDGADAAQAPNAFGERVEPHEKLSADLYDNFQVHTTYTHTHTHTHIQTHTRRPAHRLIHILRIPVRQLSGNTHTRLIHTPCAHYPYIP